MSCRCCTQCYTVHVAILNVVAVRPQAAVESAVSWERAAVAAVAEIGALSQAAAGAEKACAAMEADGERRAVEERRTRSAALEAAREVLGTNPKLSLLCELSVVSQRICLPALL
jgi:hypothetical protein